MGRIGRGVTMLCATILVAGLIGACSGTDDSGASSSGGGDASEDSFAGVAVDAPMPQAHRGIAYSMDSESQAIDNRGGGDGGGTTAVAGVMVSSPEVGPSVIKTATVKLEVKEDGLAGATRDAIAIAGRHGGFVMSTSTQDDDRATSDVVVRIPATAFERALAELEGLGEVKAEQISGEDVSQEFVDLEARLRNLEAQEAVLLRLMDRSVSVSDTIRVQRELQGVQLEIERLTGRLRYLKDLADMGTISISFTEVGAPGHKPPTGVLAKAWARAVDVALSVVAAVIVGTGALIPIAVVAAIALLVLRALWPRFSSQS
jgi:Domain of unknown function (DUF4349)